MIRSALGVAKEVVRGTIGPRIAARQPRRVDLPFDQWSLATGDNLHLWRDGVDLVELTRQFGSPLHVVDGAMLDRAAQDALGPPAAGEPRADIFYSYKTNPVPGVLERLHRRGIGAEVISPFELWLALRLQVPPDRIIYNGPAKSPESLREAVRVGVRSINANSQGEVEAVKHAADLVGMPANLGLRIALPSMWGGQFGLASGSSAVDTVVRDCLADDRVDLHGLHFHNGFTLRHEGAFIEYVRTILRYCDDLRARTGWHPRSLDLGGSLACPSVSSFGTKQHRLNRAIGSDLLPPDPTDCLSVGDAARLAGSLTAAHFAAAGLPTPQLILEPGRALTGATQLLLSTVQDVKTDGALPHAVLDVGMNVASSTASEFHQLFSATAPNDEPTTSYRIVGPICTPADVLYNNWRLPVLEPGHVLAIMDTGAYFVPFSTSFSFPRPGIVIQDGSEVHVLRRPETYEDITALDGLPPVQPA